MTRPEHSLGGMLLGALLKDVMGEAGVNLREVPPADTVMEAYRALTTPPSRPFAAGDLVEFKPGFDIRKAQFRSPMVIVEVASEFDEDGLKAAYHAARRQIGMPLSLCDVAVLSVDRDDGMRRIDLTDQRFLQHVEAEPTPAEAEAAAAASEAIPETA